MLITKREEAVLEEINNWEREQFSEHGTDLSLTYRKWLNHTIVQLNPALKARALSVIDDILFHLQSTLQHANFEKKALDHLFSEARVYEPGISAVEDMKKLTIDQLRFIARKQLARQNLIAFGQGGLTGAGGLMTALADLPVLLIINLRSIQLTGMTYGYDMRKPYEMMLGLKVFHAVSLPRELQGEAWEEIFNVTIPAHAGDAMFYEGNEDTISQSWIQQPLRQAGKLMVIRFVRKKFIQGVPLAGIALGAGMNYSFSKHVSTSAHKFYQKRYIIEKYREK